MKWTRRQGLALVQRLERALKPHYHVALAGGVLLRGESDHDLDVIVFPHKAHHFDLQEIHDALRGHLHLVFTRERLAAMWRERGIKDTKHVEVWSDASGRHPKRVDVIIFGGKS